MHFATLFTLLGATITAVATSVSLGARLNTVLADQASSCAYQCVGFTCPPSGRGCTTGNSTVSGTCPQSNITACLCSLAAESVRLTGKILLRNSPYPTKCSPNSSNCNSEIEKINWCGDHYLATSSKGVITCNANNFILYLATVLGLIALAL